MTLTPTAALRRAMLELARLELAASTVTKPETWRGTPWEALGPAYRRDMLRRVADRLGFGLTWPIPGLEDADADLETTPPIPPPRPGLLVFLEGEDDGRTIRRVHPGGRVVFMDGTHLDDWPDQVEDVGLPWPPFASAMDLAELETRRLAYDPAADAQELADVVERVEPGLHLVLTPAQIAAEDAKPRGMDALLADVMDAEPMTAAEDAELEAETFQDVLVRFQAGDAPLAELVTAAKGDGYLVELAKLAEVGDAYLTGDAVACARALTDHRKAQALPPGRYRDTDGVTGHLGTYDVIAGSQTFTPDGTKAPAILGPGVPYPYRHLGLEAVRRLVAVPAEPTTPVES